jgi:hypothetical protein
VRKEKAQRKADVQIAGWLCCWCANTGVYQSRFVAPGRSREDGFQSSPRTSGQTRDDPTNLTSADFPGNESGSFRVLGGRGSGRRGGSGRAEMGRSAGRMSTGQWVAVNEKQRERDGEREGLDASADSSSYSSPQAAKPGASGKDDSPNGSGGKSKEDIKRRRGQIQEWRMKQASPPRSQTSEPGSGPGLPSQQDEGILPLASQVRILSSLTTVAKYQSQCLSSMYKCVTGFVFLLKSP